MNNRDPEINRGTSSAAGTGVGAMISQAIVAVPRSFITSIPFEHDSFSLSGSRVSERSEEHCQYEAVKIENAKDIP